MRPARLVQFKSDNLKHSDIRTYIIPRKWYEKAKDRNIKDKGPYPWPSRLAQYCLVHPGGEAGAVRGQGQQERRFSYETDFGHVRFETPMNNR